MTDGLCECGCGEPTLVSPHTDRWHGWMKGRPRRFLAGHNNRLRRVGSHEEDRGYPTPCHIWDGALNHAGYALRGSKRGYKFEWEKLNGPVPEGQELDHLCRQRDCVNPAHLEMVTHQENMRRASAARAAESVTEGSSGIHQLRAHLSLSQTELGELLGVSGALVGLWERGIHPVREPHFGRLMRLALAFDPADCQEGCKATEPENFE